MPLSAGRAGDGGGGVRGARLLVHAGVARARTAARRARLRAGAGRRPGRALPGKSTHPYPPIDKRLVNLCSKKYGKVTLVVNILFIQ